MHFTNTVALVTGGGGAIAAELASRSAKVAVADIDPGRAAVDAIAAGEFYVFPHGDYRETVAAEQRFLLSAMREQAQPGYVEPAALTAPIR